MLNRTIVVNNVEPAILSMRTPMGIELNVGLKFLKQDATTPIDIATLLPQLAILPRSRGGIYAYDVEPVDGQLGLGTVNIPGTALIDMSGYTLELYQRREPTAPGDPKVATGLLAKGTMALEGKSYIQYGPLGMVNVPVVTGPPGPQGEQGPRGATWTSGIGAPVVTGSEIADDMYLDTSTGNVWKFTGTAWTMGTF